MPLKNRIKNMKRPMNVLLALLMIFTSLPIQQASANDDIWNISLNWGDASEHLGSEYTLTANADADYVVKVQTTIEYTGSDSKTYGAEEVQISLSDIYALTGMSVSNSDYLTVEVGAELKGSGSGKGDWYYTKTFNTSTKCNDYVFTNKNPINSSFTSTFQIVLTFKNVREYLNKEYTKNVIATLNAGSATINSNTLKFNYIAEKDTYALIFKEPEKLSWPNEILSMIDSDKWDNYIFIDVPIRAEWDEIKARVLKAGYHLDINFPSDVIHTLYYTRFDNGYMSLFSDTDVSEYPSVDTRFGYNDLYYALALPRDKYLQQGTLTLDAKWYGTYIAETTEELVAQDSVTINVNQFDYVYTGSLYSSSKDQAKGYLYREAMQYGYGKDLIGGTQEWQLGAQAVYYGSPFNMIIGDDLQYYIYKDNTFRQLQDDEKIIDSLKIYNPVSTSVDYEVWVKPVGSNSYIKHSSGNLAKSSSTKIVNLVSTSDRYSEVYVRYLNLNETIVQDDYVDVYTRLYDNVSRDGGKVISDCYNLSYVKIEILNDDLSVKETVVMDDLGVTNIAGLAEAVNALDHADGDTKLRATDKINAFSLNYGSYIYDYDALRNVTVGADNIYFTTGAIANYITNDSELLTSFDNYTLAYEYPSVLTLDEDKIKFSKINTDSPYPTFYSIEEIETLENIKITYTITDIDNGKSKVTFNIDTSNLNTPYSSTEREIYVHSTCLDFYVSIDDYYLLDLEGKYASIRVIHPYSEKVHNLVTDLYYTTGGAGSSTFSMNYPSVARNSYQGVLKYVSVDGNEYTNQVQKIDYNSEYSYKLRISSNETQMANIVLYDQIENAEASSWNGIYQGYSFDTLNAAGVDTSKFIVYYSTNRNQTQNLSSSGWVNAKSWTKSLSEVKAIAFDLRGFVLGEDDVAYVEVLMKSPSSGTGGSYVKNKTTVSYTEYDLSDTNLTTPLKTTTNLPSNITSIVLGDAKVNITVSKTWSDNNNNLSLRPSEVIVHLYQNGTEVAQATLNSAKGWKHDFGAHSKFDENFLAYEYTIEEENVNFYTKAILSNASDSAINFTVTNTLDSSDAYVDVTGTKTWDDENNANNTRPSQITIDLYQNNVKIKSTTTNAAAGWKYSFTQLPRYKNANEAYVYSVKEVAVDAYQTTYETMLAENGVEITFNQDCETESATYDYIIIYYTLNGKTYATSKYGGTSFAGKTVSIPSTDFYIYWKTDYSYDDYYGFSIDSIKPAIVDQTSVSHSEATLPSGITTEHTGKDYPESGHFGYGNSLTKLYHYTLDEAFLSKVYNIKNTLTKLPDNKELTVQKTIFVDEIWWPHGNPTFVIKVEGKDIFNNEIVKYVPMQFTEDYVNKNQYQRGEDLAVTLSTTVKLPAGTYTVSEVPVLRYQLIDIQTENASSSTSTNAIFDLATNSSGKCIFVNQCTKYQDYSHNDLVINVIE